MTPSSPMRSAGVCEWGRQEERGERVCLMARQQGAAQQKKNDRGGRRQRLRVVGVGGGEEGPRRPPPLPPCARTDLQPLAHPAVKGAHHGRQALVVRGGVLHGQVHAARLFQRAGRGAVRPVRPAVVAKGVLELVERLHQAAGSAGAQGEERVGARSVGGASAATAAASVCRHSHSACADEARRAAAEAQGATKNNFVFYCCASSSRCAQCSSPR